MKRTMRAIAAIMLLTAVACIAGCTKTKLPTVETTQAGGITVTGATVGGFVVSDGGAEITERGVCWGREANPDVSANVVNAGMTGTGSFNCTLTGGASGEWYYVFNTRSSSTVNGVANARYTKAKVANVKGVILFPDSYTHPSGVAQPVGINELGNAGWNGNDYSASDFALMQAAGAVFLPAAGGRYGTSVGSVGSYGYYWSASYYDSSSAYYVSFYDSGLDTRNSDRCSGQSVRLVCPAEN